MAPPTITEEPDVTFLATLRDSDIFAEALTEQLEPVLSTEATETDHPKLALPRVLNDEPQQN